MKIDLYGANGEIQQTIGINRIDSTVTDGYDYAINNHQTGVEGYVEIIFKDLEWFEERAQPVFNSLLDAISPDNELITEITSFYPHLVPIHKRVPKNMTGKGIGSCVLDTILMDLEQNDFLNFYVHNPQQRVYDMLLRRNFQELPVNEPHHNHLFKRAG